MQLLSKRRRSDLKKNWYKFSKNPLSKIGLVVVIAVTFLGVFAKYVSPYPQHAEIFIDKKNAFQPPSWQYLFGTDSMGRDVLSRVFFGFGYSLLMVAFVTACVVPLGVVLGLIAGYYKDSFAEIAIMRVTDIFLGLPPLLLALAVCAVLTPNLMNAMLATSLCWWPWYTRLTFSVVSSVRNEYFVQAAEVIGSSTFHILFREILPSVLPSVLTKMTLDAGWIILLGASLSFVGLGAQPPTPDLGTMVAGGAKYLPELWWMSVFPAVAIAFIILGFNLLGDGVRDMFSTERV